MIQPPGMRGAAFGESGDGDLRIDEEQRRRVSGRLGIAPEWAFVSQVHGKRVVQATAPGRLGEADAIFTVRHALPIAVATADCVPVIIEGNDFAAVIHAGWRGAAQGVIPETLAALRAKGLQPERAAIGPSIGPCCYEVGPEVAERFPNHVGSTDWGTTSVDLAGSLAESLASLDVWRSRRCTYSDPDLNSYRRNRTKARQVAVAWLPAG